MEASGGWRNFYEETRAKNALFRMGEFYKEWDVPPLFALLSAIAGVCPLIEIF